ncbi:MAG: hypothetical protein NWQ98_05575, partial [Schleiferiaceae bacterium]|nr:hypothetical protein [Schleiferiaceae bacterium]
MKRLISLCTWAATVLPVVAQGNLDFSLGNGLTAASADGQYRMAMGGSVQLLGTSIWDAEGRGL